MPIIALATGAPKIKVPKSTWLEPKTGGALVPYTPPISYAPPPVVPASTAPPSAPPLVGGGSSGLGSGAGGGNPATVAKNWQDYYNEAAGTQQWQAASQAYTTLLNKLKSQGQSTINTVLANLGYDLTPQLNDPYLAGYLGQGGDFQIDPAALAAGAGNPLSAKAQIDRAFNTGSLDSLYAANARGTLGSGASTAAINALEQNRQLQQYTAQSDALNAIRNALSGYAEAQDTAGSNLRSQQSQIMSALAAMPGPVYDPGTATSQPASLPLGGGDNTAPSAAPAGIQWGGQTFTNVTALTRYLAQHGVSYATWKNNHPAAAAKLEGGY